MANGLFLTPEQVLAAESQLRQQQAVKQGASLAGGSMFDLGYQLAGKAPMLFGGQEAVSPEVQMARARMNALQNADLSTREGSFAAAKSLRDAGDMEGFAQLTQHGLGIKAPEEPSASTSHKKMMELLNQGVNPKVAQGIAYGAYRQVTDPSTGDVSLVDLRKAGGSIPPQEAEEATTILTKGTRKEEKFTANVTKLADDVVRTNVPQAESALGEIEGMVNIIRERGDTDLPGFGLSAALPDIALSDEGKALRQRVSKLFNITLKDRSGAAVTSQELERLKREFGAGALKTDNQLLDALNIYRRELEDLKKTVAAGYSPDVVREFEARGGVRLTQPTKENKRLKFNATTGRLE
jgi:hypothetical protein